MTKRRNTPKVARRRGSAAALLNKKVELLTLERDEALEQQRATSEVLKVISGSTIDLQAVLDTLVESAARLCDADKAIIYKRDGAFCRLAANYNFSREFEEFTRQNPIGPGRGTIAGRVVLEGKTVHIPDVLADPDYTATKYQSRGEYRSNLGVPLLREGETIGVFTLTRSHVRPYTEKQIELATTFADQAVIAIENARLFDEAKSRTMELARSVEELRALGDVSQAVNSTIDLQTVLSTIIAKAVQLSGTEAGTIYVFDETSQEFQVHASYGMDEVLIAAIKDRRIRLGEMMISQAALQRRPMQLADVTQDTSSLVIDVIQRAGFRAVLTVPLLGADQIVGALVVRRKAPGEFSENTVNLLQTFGAQSVLAIQNARLFDEVQNRTDDLAESLQQQTATADVLKVISRSSFDLQTVLNTLVESAATLCEAYDSSIWRADGERLILVAHYGPITVESLPLVRGTVAGRTVLDGRTFHIADMQSAADEFPESSENARRWGFRAILCVPLLREGRSSPHRGAAVHGTTGRTASDLRRSGRHRHRERPPAQRAARIAAAADCYCRRAESH